MGIGLGLLFVDMAGKPSAYSEMETLLRRVFVSLSQSCCSEGGLSNCVLTCCLTHFPALLFTGSMAITTVKKSSQSSKDKTRKTQQICVEREMEREELERRQRGREKSYRGGSGGEGDRRAREESQGGRRARGGPEELERREGESWL